jgi:malonate transporter and related proteins
MLFALLLPLFLVTGLGCLLARSGVMATNWQGGLSELTAKILIPAFLFSGAFKHGIPAAASWQFLTAFFLPLIALFAAASSARDAGSAPRALATTHSNTAFVGIPVLTQAFGPDSLQYAFPVIAFHSLVAFSLYYLASPGEKLVGSLLNAVKNPIVISLLLGLACNFMGASLPAALPCALLALGASLAGFRIHSWPETVVTVIGKLVVLPACVLGMGYCVINLPAPATAVLVVLASCPVGVNGAALVQADGKNPAQFSSAILLSSIACIATIPLWIWIVRAL